MKQKIVLTVFAFFLCIVTIAQLQYYLVTGTYTSGKSEGIYVYQFNSNDGTAKAVSSVKISNPSFVAVSPDEKYIYSVEENAVS
jgi:6-phosphogluconolactonase